MGTAIEGKGYCSNLLRNRLAAKDMRFVAHARANMVEKETRRRKKNCSGDEIWWNGA
ncbi:MAG: hypothetical protein LBS68_01825 [Puniceicoccales bacterium]|nr:hypothetical protein [Puniceicoccales bacterium]